MTAAERQERAALREILGQVPLDVRLHARDLTERRDEFGRVWNGDLQENVRAVLFIPGDIALQSPNETRGKHWGQRAREENPLDARALFAYGSCGEKRLAVPVRADLIVFRGRTLDEDNIRSAMKGTVDRIVRRGLLPDDSPTWLSWGTVEQVTAARWQGGNAWCVMICRERGNP